jgi:hypothetical protein
LRVRRCSRETHACEEEQCGFMSAFFQVRQCATNARTS